MNAACFALHTSSWTVFFSCNHEKDVSEGICKARDLAKLRRVAGHVVIHQMLPRRSKLD